MKTLIAFLVCGFATAGSAQSSLKTFTSSDGLFRFQYPDMLVNCAPRQTPTGAQERGGSEEAQPGTSISDACVSQGANCDGPGSGGRAMACFAYPKERFKDKPAFVAATFYVSEILSAKTEEVCLKGSPGWFVIKSEAETTTINHLTFKAFEIGDNWTSGGQSGPAYRTFHSGKCYELGIQNVFSRAEYDPGTVREFTKQDSSDVEDRLRQALNSFVFLK
ncbi:MAG: hypothetical protein WAJ99_10385 [Candidatus Sulfotelmatobacter sp.]